MSKKLLTETKDLSSVVRKVPAPTGNERLKFLIVRGSRRRSRTTRGITERAVKSSKGSIVTPRRKKESSCTVKRVNKRMNKSMFIMLKQTII